MALSIGLSACERERTPQYPAAGYGQPGYYPGQPYPQGQPPYGQPNGQPPHGQPPGQPPYGQPPSEPPNLLGTAITGFGVLLSQLPMLPSQLPPLPTWDPTQPFPFPWPFQPAPGPSPGPSPAPTPEPLPPAGDWPAQWVAFEAEVLQLSNQQRARGAVCGGQAMAPAGPLADHPALRRAARDHSQDMARRNYFDHTSPEGHTPMQRAHAAGFPGSFVGENIAAGQPTPTRVVEGWMNSPGHCLNLMDPRFTLLGVGYAYEGANSYGHLWTQNFGR